MTLMKRPTCLQKGQALSETLVGLLALVPVLILIPYIGKYLDVKHKTLDAGRYAVWERSVFSDGGSWGAGENQKSDEKIESEIVSRLLSDPRTPISADIAAANQNVLWQDHGGADLVDLSSYSQALTEFEDPFNYGLAGRSFLLKPENASLVTALAYDGLPLLNELGGLSSLLGGALDFNLGLNDGGFAEANVSLTAFGLPAFLRDGVIQSVFPQSGNAFDFQSPAAMLTDAWVPGSEDNYRDRLDGLVIDEVLQVLVLPGTVTFGLFPLFREGLDGLGPDLETESTVIPPRYVDTDE